MNIVIRVGAESDAPALADLAARTFSETFAADNDPDDLALHNARAYGIPQQRAELADPNITTLLVEVDGQLAGYAQLRSDAPPTCVTSPHPIELWRFYVSRQWHGLGIAQALFQRVKEEASARGGQTLWLGVWERNHRAKAFYNKNGFTDVGSHVFMVGTDAQTDRVMTRALVTPFDLERFVITQASCYDAVIAELRAGRKRSHWMWFIFPQLAGLGRSAMSRQYAISNAAEAKAYLAHPILGHRLRECAAIVNGHQGHSAREIFGNPDDLKLHSCATLFATVSDDPVFRELLVGFFNGERDEQTITLLKESDR